MSHPASPNADAAVKVLDFLLSDASRALQLAADVGFGEWVVPIHFSAGDFPEGTDERVARFFADFAATTGAGQIGYTTWRFWLSRVSLYPGTGWSGSGMGKRASRSIWRRIRRSGEESNDPGQVM